MLSHSKPQVFFTIFTLLATPLIWAEEPPVEEEEQHPIVAWTETCLNKEEGNVDMQACFSEAYKKWDAELNEVYQELLEQLQDKERALQKSSSGLGSISGCGVRVNRIRLRRIGRCLTRHTPFNASFI